MNYKGLLKIVSGLGLILFLGICFTACNEEEPIPPPTLDVFITVDGFTVNIAAESPEATSWQWNYGDGTVSDSVGSHSYTYATGGEFSIVCTVTGEGGETTETEAVTIATIQDLLSGGSGASKTWVLSRTPGGVDGVGHIKSELVPNIFPAIADMLDFIGIPDEYDNEYTFSFDGSYDIDNVNGDIISPWVYSSFEVDPSDIVITTSYGFFQITSPNPVGATWTLHENADLTLETVYDEDIDVGPKPGVPETIEYENVDYITFSDGAFITLLDYTTTAMIREISPERMVISVFYHEFMGDPGNDGDLYLRPSLALTLTYITK
ncbi:MAG: PKD domain-containing protein [Bacteroidota bacterium]